MKVVIAVVVVAVVVIAWFLFRGHGAAGRDAGVAPTDARIAQVTSSDAATNAPAPDATAARLTHISAEERAHIAEQIAQHAQAQHAPHLAAPDDAQVDMESSEGVLHQILVVVPDLKEEVMKCKPLAGSATGFTTGIKLSGDADVGTLVDAPDPLVSKDHAKLSKEFDDCVRNALQLIELPPIETGKGFSVELDVDL